jgi:hypothetical protein
MHEVYYIYEVEISIFFTFYKPFKRGVWLGTTHVFQSNKRHSAVGRHCLQTPVSRTSLHRRWKETILVTIQSYIDLGCNDSLKSFTATSLKHRSLRLYQLWDKIIMQRVGNQAFYPEHQGHVTGTLASRLRYTSQCIVDEEVTHCNDCMHLILR